MRYIFCGHSTRKIDSKINLQPNDRFYHLPLIATKPLSINIDTEKDYAAVVCASQSVIRHLPNISKIKTKKWFAVGPETAALMKTAWQLSCVHVPSVYNALSVAGILMKYIKSGSILWLGAKGGVMTGVNKLSSLGFDVHLHQPYQSYSLLIENSTSVWKKEASSLGEFLAKESVWMFTSPLTVKSYLDQKLNRISHRLCCLGNTTASLFLNKGLALYYVAKQSTIESFAKGLSHKIISVES